MAGPLCAIFGGVLSCGGSARDAVSESREARVAEPGGTSEAYEYVARRPLAVVALAEARGIAPPVARAAVDRLADALDACITQEARGGKPPQGAARFVAGVDGQGAVGAPRVRVDPSDAARTAVLCLVAPARLLSFPPSDAGARGLAIEALWGEVVPSGAEAPAR